MRPKQIDRAAARIIRASAALDRRDLAERNEAEENIAFHNPQLDRGIAECRKHARRGTNMIGSGRKDIRKNLRGANRIFDLDPQLCRHEPLIVELDWSAQGNAGLLADNADDEFFDRTLVPA